MCAGSVKGFTDFCSPGEHLLPANIPLKQTIDLYGNTDSWTWTCWTPPLDHRHPVWESHLSAWRNSTPDSSTHTALNAHSSPTAPSPTLSPRSSTPHADGAPSLPHPGSGRWRPARGGGAPPQPGPGVPPPLCPRRAAAHPPPWPWRGGRRAGLCRAGGTGPDRRRLRGRAEPRGAGRCPRCCRAERRGRARPPRVRSRPVRLGPPRGTADGLLPPPARSPWGTRPRCCGRRYRLARGWPRRGAAREGCCCASRGPARRVPEPGYLWGAAVGPLGETWLPRGGRRTEGLSGRECGLAGI